MSNFNGRQKFKCKDATISHRGGRMLRAKPAPYSKIGGALHLCIR